MPVWIVSALLTFHELVLVLSNAERFDHSRQAVAVMSGASTKCRRPHRGFAAAPTADLSTWDGSPDHPAFTHLLHTISLTTGGPAPTTQMTARDKERKRRRISFVIFAAIAIFLAGIAAGAFVLEVLMQRHGP
jgi:hypothetical protein